MGANISHRRKRVSSVQSKKEKECPSITHKSPTTSNSSDSVILSGRKFHSDPNSVYWLPSDEEEMDRLVGQHFALKTLFEGNIPQVAFKILDFEKGVKILDLGCGPGTWIMDMATEYPNSEFVGIDMCDVFPTNIRPANVTFQVSNALEGLPFEDNSFDIVNFSLFILALKKDQWLPLMKEIRRILRPGGLFHSREASMLLLGNQFVQWASQVFEQRLIERNQEPAICDKIKDLMQEAGFDILSCVKKHTYPARPDHLSREFLWDIKHIFKGCQPFLQDHLGLTNEQYPAFLQQLVTECQKSPEPRWDMVSTLGRKST